MVTLESPAMEVLDAHVLVRILNHASDNDIRVLYILMCVTKGIRQHALQV
jgi:hypothetical protein